MTSDAAATGDAGNDAGGVADATAIKRPTLRTLVLLVATRMVLCPLVCGATLM